MKRRIYISGPMRGYPAMNFPAFFKAEEHFLDAGYDVLNPARMDMLEPLTPTPDNPHPWSERDLAAVRRAHEIAMLPGWGRSPGAMSEATLAAWLGKLIRLPCQAGGWTPPQRFVIHGWSVVIQSTDVDELKG